MAFFARWIPRLAGRKPLPPRVFPKNFPRISADKQVEEEYLPQYKPINYYPVQIGEVLASRYQVVGKLGFGATSTVWLARDLAQHNHVVIKVFIRKEAMKIETLSEVSIYKKIRSVSASSSHPGRRAIRSLLDDFAIHTPSGQHHCLVHPPLWESVKRVLHRNPVARFPPVMMGTLLRQVFLALDFLHTECRLIHTDIKADNLVYSLDATDPVLERFEENEITNPSLRKQAEDGRFIYVSRPMDIPSTLGYPVLCDFGEAMPGNETNTLDMQPDAYRSPEMILRMPWSYEIDIWNVGCMVWDLCEGGNLFHYRDPEDHLYRSTVHMASIISLLGSPPRELYERCTQKQKFYNDKGEFDGNVAPLPATSWDEIETTLDKGEDREMFLRMMRKMMEWLPEKRATAAQMLEDDWIEAHRTDKPRHD